jgi:acylphosphatase
MNSIGAKILIDGFVQGVGYRYFCYDRARNLGLTGWVKNNPDSTVSAKLEGDRSLIEALIKELRVGPRSAVVRDINIEWIEFKGEFAEFKVTY